MRRYAIIQRARDADVIGILVGTLGVGKYCLLVGIKRMGLNVLGSILFAVDGPPAPLNF